MHKQRRWTRRGALRALIAVGLAIGAPASAATRGFTISSFDAVRVDAPMTVVLTTGVGVSARADGDQGMLDRLRLDVSGRLLTISLDRTPSSDRKNGAATLRLSTGMVDRVLLAGGGSIAINRLKGLRGDIILGGNGDVSVGDLQLDRVDVTLAGGGRAALTGRAGIANIRVTGPGIVAAEPLRVRQATIFNDGAGSVSLTTEVNARVTATGSGDVTISGRPACTIDNRGTGHIQCGSEGG